ncbi:helix-turn-helix domain-containing protein [Natrialba sp. PRR66]|uniref:helix-turn-helix domain-containing protein n=1 Tax=Natrialba sp. PRR66 TaxID=3098146 RepID=UPI002B1DD1FD|nr:helix-turn-helix domain-containing protein [Natrialba sp. PRR66]
MPTIQLQFDATASADPLAKISSKFPDTQFTVLASHLTDDGLLGLVEIATANRNGIVQQFDEAPRMVSHEVVYNDEQIVLIQYLFPEAEPYRALRRTGNLPQFPVRMEDGWLFAEMTASHERLSEYTDRLAAAEIPVTIQSVTQSPDPSEVLTERQWEFVIEAVERGYYDSPRRCTLTELAQIFEINSSAASGVLHRAEGRIIKRFITEAGGIQQGE